MRRGTPITEPGDATSYQGEEALAEIYGTETNLADAAAFHILNEDIRLRAIIPSRTA